MEQEIVRYNPKYLDYKPIFTKEELENFEKNKKTLPLSSFLGYERTREEILEQFIYSTAKLEGNTYTEVESSLLLKTNGKIFAKEKSGTDAIMLLNLKNSFEFLLDNIEEKPQSLKNFIKDMHFLIANNLLDYRSCGVVREYPVKISNTNYYPLDNKFQLEEEMDYMLAIYEDIEHPLEKAIYIHNNMSYLQYFGECNGIAINVLQEIC